MAGVICGSCGTAALWTNAKFCDECDAPMAAGVQRAEDKQVSVVFADVVHSMDTTAPWVRSGCAKS